MADPTPNPETAMEYTADTMPHSHHDDSRPHYAAAMAPAIRVHHIFDTQARDEYIDLALELAYGPEELSAHCN